MPTIQQFQKKIWDHYRRHARKTLPWRKTRDPYAILVSEIMLQQTQAGRVEGYYERFLKQFPDFKTLSAASSRDVLLAWQGLGYNRRALFLKKVAQEVIARYHGKLPEERHQLEMLPGIGKGTSGSLMAFAFNKPEIFIETNIRRVFIHSFFKNKKSVTDDELKRYIERSMDRKNPREWYWALMDYGASMKNMEDVEEANSNRRSSSYKKQSSFLGSDRALRGKLLRALLVNGKKSLASELVPEVLSVSVERSKKIVADLIKEGFLIKKGKYFFINK
jgi:A/G-specific adenine glycosylase